ncbi:MAG: Na/Pi symporter [Anaerobutyricum soehngenii]
MSFGSCNEESDSLQSYFWRDIYCDYPVSSGATTVMEVSFVNAGLLTLEQSVGITFGANIGTTITAQLVSLKLTAIAPYIIFAGACLMMFGNKPITRKISEVIFGFGALFLGINSMTGALSRIPEYPVIMHWFSYLKNPFIALLVGLHCLCSSTELFCNRQCAGFDERDSSSAGLGSCRWL